ncbi:MAG: ABC transporter permease [Actinomycetes bacterium]
MLSPHAVGADVRRFIGRRLFTAAIQVLIVTMIAYLLFFVISTLTGANPAQRVAGRAATAEQVARVAHQLGLDRPWYSQYWHFLSGVVRGDFGYSFQQRLPVSEILFPAASVTASLVVGAAILWLIIAIPVGLVGALRPRSVWDRLSAVAVQIAISAPVFWVAPMLAYLLAYQPSQGKLFGFSIPPVTIFPIQGYTPPTQSISGWATSLMLPWLALAVGFAAFYARFVRAFTLEQLHEEYVLVARAKGASTSRILRSHVAPIIAPAIITLLGLDVGAMLGGALFVEVTFGLPGLGYTAFSAIQNLDYPLTIGVITFAALMAVLANTIADVAQAALDPRVRIAGGSGNRAGGRPR